MGYGMGGYSLSGGVETVVADLARRGIETSVQNGSDTDILVFNMGSSVIIGESEDGAGSHTAATSVQVDAV